MTAGSRPDASRPGPKGRGAHSRPPNRFERTHRVDDREHLELLQDDDEPPESTAQERTEFIPDHAKSIVSENQSPDVGFRYSVNPYRGCEHGCAYCYARPTHEYYGLSAGLDFETRIFFKPQAPQLLGDWLGRPGWKPEPICFSGVTDCYQPAERRFQLTRECLKVALEARQPVSIVTKNALVTRDLDLLGEMSALGIVQVALSVTTLDEELARTLEPRTSRPSARLRAIRELACAGVPVRVMLAPVIPGLNDSEIPHILKASREAGAGGASYILLRLPLTVRPVFLEWLAKSRPTYARRIEALIRSTRQGRINDSAFGKRMRGTGPLAEQVEKTFRVFARKYGLDRTAPLLDASQFRPPRPASGQLQLF